MGPNRKHRPSPACDGYRLWLAGSGAHPRGRRAPRPCCPDSLLVAVGVGMLYGRAATITRDVAEPRPGPVLASSTLSLCLAIWSALRQDRSISSEATAFAGIVVTAAAISASITESARRRVRAEEGWIAATIAVPGRRFSAADSFGDVSKALVFDLRPGEHTVVEAGEVVPVDLTVTGGEVEILPWIGASTPTRRRNGDSVVAGACVVAGKLKESARGQAMTALLHAYSSTRGVAPTLLLNSCGPPGRWWIGGQWLEDLATAISCRAPETRSAGDRDDGACSSCRPLYTHDGVCRVDPCHAGCSVGFAVDLLTAVLTLGIALEGRGRRVLCPRYAPPGRAGTRRTRVCNYGAVATRRALARGRSRARGGTSDRCGDPSCRTRTGCAFGRGAQSDLPSGEGCYGHNLMGGRLERGKSSVDARAANLYRRGRDADCRVGEPWTRSSPGCRWVATRGSMRTPGWSSGRGPCRNPTSSRRTD